MLKLRPPKLSCLEQVNSSALRWPWGTLTLRVCDILSLHPELLQVVPDPPAERDSIVGILEQVHVALHQDEGHLTVGPAARQMRIRLLRWSSTPAAVQS